MKLVGPEEAMMKSSHPERLEKLLEFHFPAAKSLV
jgi:hypothetical protein